MKRVYFTVAQGRVNSGKLLASLAKKNMSPAKTVNVHIKKRIVHSIRQLDDTIQKLLKLYVEHFLIYYFYCFYNTRVIHELAQDFAESIRDEASQAIAEVEKKGELSREVCFLIIYSDLSYLPCDFIKTSLIIIAGIWPPSCKLSVFFAFIIKDCWKADWLVD